jgi:hypothetical protein
MGFSWKKWFSCSCACSARAHQHPSTAEVHGYCTESTSAEQSIYCQNSLSDADDEECDATNCNYNADTPRTSPALASTRIDLSAQPTPDCRKVIMPPSPLAQTWPQLYGCPQIYWLNMDRSTGRKERMAGRFKTHHLSENAIRVAAYDGSTKTCIDKLRACIVDEDVRFIESQNIDWKVVATTLGHLRMIQTIGATLPCGVDVAFACEDDVSFEYVERWQRPLAHYLGRLPADWEIIQLGYQGPLEHELNELNARGFLTVGWRLRHYGAFAYAVHRRGVNHLLKRHWNVDTQQWRLRVEHEQTYASVVADAVLFDGLECYTSTVPWFVYEGLDSTIHPEYLSHHKEHLQRVRALYDSDVLQFFGTHESTELTKFVIVIPGHNNSSDVERCLASVCAQHYPRTHFRIVYGDDASTDDTLAIVKAWILRYGRSDQVTLLHSNTRQWACATRDLLIREHAHDDEVVVLVDGDDQLADPHALAFCDSLYVDKPDIWLTYGGYSSNCGKRRDWSDWPADAKARVGGIRASEKWYCSPLRTFRSPLYRHIREADLRDGRGNYFRSATDVAAMIPMLEMAGLTHSHYVPAESSDIANRRVLYIYTIHPNQQYNAERVAEQRANALTIYRRQPYHQIHSVGDSQ